MVKKNPAKPVDTSAAALSSGALRLLRKLAMPGAYAFEETGAGAARCIIAAAKNNVSIRVGAAEMKDAAQLVARGLALWRKDGARRRLILSDPGQALASRLDAPEGLNPFLAQHKPMRRGPADATPGAASVFHDQEESPLAWLATRKDKSGQALINASCLLAGDRLRRDLTTAAMLPRVTANWSALNVSRSDGAVVTFSEVQIAARQRVDQALAAVGPDFAGLLIDVCGFLKGLEQLESERAWPRRSGKLALCLALRQLCRHYGIAERATGPNRSLGVRHWGASDFRPNLSQGGAG